MDNRTVAVYLRVSSDLQAKANGTASQRAAIGHWLTAEGLDWSMVREFEDLAVSGRTMSRPAWGQMLGTIRSGQIKTVVAYDLSRCGRTLKGLLEWIDEMQELGVRIVFVKDALDVSSAMGRMVLSIMGAVGEFMRKMSAERVRDGQLARIAAGKPVGGACRVDPARNGCAKLTAEQWAELIDRHRCGAGTGMLAGEYGVAVRTIQKRLVTAAACS